jgi:hypothetical protein
MQLRSGRSTLATRTQTQVRTPRRGSRNYEEFLERRKYQEEQKQVEESIYEEEEEKLTTPAGKKWKHISKRISHWLYLSECQRKQKCSFTEKIKTINEIYEFILYNMDDLIELFNGEMKHKKKFPEVLYNKGNELRRQINQANKRTRGEQQLAWECNDLINHATQLIYRHIISVNL